MLGVSFELILNIVNKDLKIFKVFLEKSFEFWPCNRSDTLIAALLLDLSKADNIIKE